MNTKYNDVINDLVEVLQEAGKKESVPLDIQAKVIRVDNDVIWVHLPGGVDETPVRRTINAKQGDIVQVKISNGDAWITGNATAPPTDDARAITAQNTAQKADEKAITAQETADQEVNERKAIIREYDNGVLVAKQNNNYGALINASGSFDVVQLTWSGKEPIIGSPVARFGRTAMIGDQTGRRIEISTDEISMYNESSSSEFSINAETVYDQEIIQSNIFNTIGSDNSHEWEAVINNTPTNNTTIKFSALYYSIANHTPIGTSLYLIPPITSYSFIYGTAEIKKNSAWDEETDGALAYSIIYDGDKTFTIKVVDRRSYYSSFEVEKTVLESRIVYTAAETTIPSCSIGLGTVASKAGVAIGKYNAKDQNNDYAFIVGKGTSDNSRSNALTVDWGGNVAATGNITTDGTVNIASSIKRKTYTWTISSIGANEYTSTEVNPPSESGYTPIGIAGWGIDGTGTSHVKWVKCHINNSGKLVIGLMNDNSNARTNWTATVHILYAKS